MVQQSGSKEQLDAFVAKRRGAQALFTTKDATETVGELRRLDEHIKSFLDAIRKDAKEQERTLLKGHAKAFEDEVHAELDALFERSKQDLLLFQKVLKGLSAYRQELKGLVDDPSLSHLAESELNYADLLVKTADEKLSTLSLLFRKLRK